MSLFVKTKEGRAPSPIKIRYRICEASAGKVFHGHGEQWAILMFHKRVDSSYCPPERSSVSLVAPSIKRLGERPAAATRQAQAGSLTLPGELSASCAARSKGSRRSVNVAQCATLTRRPWFPV